MARNERSAGRLQRTKLVVLNISSLSGSYQNRRANSSTDFEPTLVCIKAMWFAVEASAGGRVSLENCIVLQFEVKP